VARWQKGDCFDMSILLCSLLIGVGYNAFCIYGLAPKEITTKNESLMECKFLNEGLIDEHEEYEQEEEGVTELFRRIDRRGKIISNFETTEERRKRAYEEEIRRKGLEIDDDEPDELAPDLYLNRRVHCWVYLRKGKRGVSRDLFIEPTTGRIYETTNSPYIAVDGLFNNYNFWIHMYPKHEVKTIVLNELYCMSWEFIMIDPYMFNINEEDEPHELGLEENAAVRHEKDENKDLKEFSEILDMPPPWPPKIFIDKDAFIRGTPYGETTTFFQKVKIERYAHYSQSDGLVQKFTIYEDFKKLRVKEFRYFYEHRSDKLQIVRRFPMQFKTIEQYLPGKPNNWKQCIEIDRRIRIVKYYPNRNVDGLIKRIELIGEKTTEHYINRDDRVVYRSVRYDPEHHIQQGRDVSFESYHYAETNDKGDFTKKRKVFISKITQKFEKHPRRPAAEQIQKVLFDFIKQKITVTYHLEEGEINPKTREFSREIITGFSKPDGSDKKADDPVVQMENQQIIDLEKRCLSNIKFQEDQFESEISYRRLENVQLEKTLYDKARDKFKENLNKKEDEDSERTDENDELRPYLEELKLNVKKPDLSYEEALNIKNKIINKYKDRVVARATIIEQRLSQKHKEMQALDDAHNKKPDDKAIADKLAELRFKTEILDARSNRF
jgi:hypothetical protein